MRRLKPTAADDRAATSLLRAAAAATTLAALSLWAAAGRGAEQQLPQQQLPLPAATVPLPQLVQRDGTARMMVGGHPYLILAGELHNSTGSSSLYMQPIWDELTRLNLNTVIGSASWELVEPIEGQFDFSAVDDEIHGAEQHGLHLVLIWFGAWKNASSSYAPIWVKWDPARFPRAAGKPGSASLSSFGDAADALTPFAAATVAEDADSFRALMRHIRQMDTRHTVIMVQVENEVGILGSSRDHSALAEAAWSQPVPAQLIRYLVAHEGSLSPELSAAWGGHGYKKKGDWAAVFGTGPSADEIFMAWGFGRAVEKIAAAGKQELPIPMYANAWLGPQPGETTPGEYPSGGPVAGMLDVWRAAAAPAVDLFAPDIYVADFQGVCASYHRSGNPLFIAESRADVANMFWAVGHDHALGYSPFGIEDLSGDERLAAAYGTLRGLAPLILSGAPGTVITVMKDDPATVKAFRRLTGLAIRFTGASEGRAKDLPPAPVADAAGRVQPDNDRRGFALVIATGPSEFIIAGSDVAIESAAAQIGSVDEMLVRQNRLVPGRRLNGDEQHLATHLSWSADKIEVRRVITYTPARSSGNERH